MISLVNKTMIDMKYQYDVIKKKQVRKCKYKIDDIFVALLESKFFNVPLSKCAIQNHFGSASSGNISYWTKKIFCSDTSFFYDASFDISNLHKNEKYSHVHNSFIKYDRILKPLFENYSICAVDGSVLNISVKNSFGTDIASISISLMLDISSNIIKSHIIDYNCNENNALYKHKLNKSTILILDRGYATMLNLKKLNKETNYIIRLKKNLLISKTFIKSKSSESIINIGKKHSIKLIKYKIDKTTKKIITTKYENEKTLKNEDSDDVYILATNMLDLTAETCAILYKKRWLIETSIKHIKQNFSIQHIVKESNSDIYQDKLLFWTNMSISLYNIAVKIKNNLDNTSHKNAKLSKCCSYVVNLFTNIKNYFNNKDQLTKICNEIILISKRHNNNRKPNSNVERKYKRGRYESYTTITNREQLLNNKIS